MNHPSASGNRQLPFASGITSTVNRSLLLVALLFLQVTVQAQLQWPAITQQTKPWTRWWWMGNAVDRRNLTLNMEKYQAAGLGGLELTPIYGVKGYEDHFINYLSPAWMDLFSFTLQEARRLGLGLDMTSGTGWPFGGGPLIDSVYACKEMFYKTWTIKAGQNLQDTVRFVQEPLIHTDGFPKPTMSQLVEPVYANKNLQALALDQVRFVRSVPLQALMAYSAGGAVLDLTGKVDGSGHLQWTAPADGGDWSLYAIFQGWHGKMVERAAPGAEGNVIDHFSSLALKKYLSRFDTAFAGHDLTGLRAFFNDSYEVDDARGQSNWTPGFFDAFRQHRGYDLREHLPALFGKDTKENNDRVLCDYRETISDLLLEQFTLAWGNWAHSKGAIIRDQAHGSPANILDLYAVSDIPETEGTDILRYKFGTSAAHVTGKRLASAETVTWLNEHFLSSLSDIKKAEDKYLLGGVNHIFYHGTAYSPQDDAWPGWLFYASVHFTPNDPSWQNISTLNKYIARCQSFLQQGAPDNDVLLYCPVYDSWSDRGPALLKHFDRMEPEFNGTGFKACAELMLQQGYAFDYISDRQLQQTTASGSSAAADRSSTTPGHSATPSAPSSAAPGTPSGTPGLSASILTSGGSRYQTILLPDCHYISVAAFEKLIGLAEAGATILVYKALPSDVPGWGDHQQRSGTLQQLLSNLSFTATKDAGIQQASLGKGVFLVGDDCSRLLAYAGIRREALVDDSLDFVRRTYEGANVYFIVNHSGKKWEGNVPLSVPFRSAAIFNPMTGRSGLASQQSGKVYLQLMPGESCLVQTSGTALSASTYPYYQPAGQPAALKGEWKIEFVEGGPRLPAPVSVSQLGSWTALDGEDVKKFSGTAKYTLSFTHPAGKATAWLLDLGKVNETAQVFLNGNKIATLIGPDYQVIIPASDLQEKNTLEVRVSNLMVNRIEDMDRQGIVWKKFYNTNFPPHEKADRGADGLFDSSKWAPLDSGLSGPVTITPLRIGKQSK